MKVLSNVHTHTRYCDGKNTVDEMARSAVGLGLTTLGFSGHSPMDNDSAKNWVMAAESVPLYRADINAAREKYAGQIDLLCGLELDYDSDPKWALGFDYSIGSVHQLNLDGQIFAVDNVINELDSCVMTHFGGNCYDYCAAYYDKLSTVVERTGCDIIGHFDLVTKFNEKHPRFDENDPRYREPALACLEKLATTGAVFEINTGAISRGYRTTPYPAPWILREINRLGGSVMLSSDTHSASTILYAFDEAAALAKECGFVSVKALTAKGFTDIPL